MELLLKIFDYVLASFLHIWPYLVITIPFAVAIQVSGSSKYITRIMGYNPYVSILLATIVGAFSPFCSCGVIPIIASLLIGGVPLAPVMSFWIASPSMDPEIFFLSASVLGIKLSVWRLVATFVISLGAGLITQLAVKVGWLDTNNTLVYGKQTSNNWRLSGWSSLIIKMKQFIYRLKVDQTLTSQFIVNESVVSAECCVSLGECSCQAKPILNNCCESNKYCCTEKKPTTPLKQRIITETWKAMLMTSKFMALAFLINAVIIFCLPQDLFSGILTNNGPFAIVIAALIGIPVYTSNITALPLVNGLLTLGMSPGAALAFLIAGPATTLPAMSAVWGIVNRKVFLLYLLFPFAGAILFGWLYSIFQ